jgi:two-component system CheB/CheR fusion protein
MDGYEVAQELRKLPNMDKAVVVAVTGYGREEDQQRALAAGCNAHLVKPVDYDKLADLLRLPATGTDRTAARGP